MHSVIQLAADSFGVRRSKLNQVKRVADEQPDVIERVVQLVRNAGGQLAERGELSCLDELFLLVAEFLFAPLHLLGGFAKIVHDVDHRFAAAFEPDVRLM